LQVGENASLNQVVHMCKVQTFACC